MLLVSQPVSQYTSAKCHRNVLQGTRYKLLANYRVSQKKVGSQKTSNCSNSLNFEAKIKCNTIKPNVPKWRKTCTGLKFDLLDFYGPQSNIHTF